MNKAFFIFLMIFLVNLIHVSALPQLPMTLSGNATINDEPIANEETIIAKIDDNEAGEAVITNSPRFDLMIIGEADDSGKTVTFYVNDVKADYEDTWSSGKIVYHNLIFEVEGYVPPKVNKDNENTNPTLSNKETKEALTEQKRSKFISIFMVLVIVLIGVSVFLAIKKWKK